MLAAQGREKVINTVLRCMAWMAWDGISSVFRSFRRGLRWIYLDILGSTGLKLAIILGLCFFSSLDLAGMRIIYSTR
jgi:hypothetical protein